MIDLILIIILLILVLFLFVKKERFQSNRLYFQPQIVNLFKEEELKENVQDYFRDPKLKQFYEGDKVIACSKIALKYVMAVNHQTYVV